MILQYFTKKENKEKSIAEDTYKYILKKSNFFLQNNNFFIKKDYNSSFEIISILIILFIQLNIKNKVYKYKKINEYLVSFFVSDLDESLRTKGIGDMSIGKYVKSYVKKFYFRLSIFPSDYNIQKEKLLFEYINKINIVKEEETENAYRKFSELYIDINNSDNS